MRGQAYAANPLGKMRRVKRVAALKYFFKTAKQRPVAFASTTTCSFETVSTTTSIARCPSILVTGSIFMVVDIIFIPFIHSLTNEIAR